MSDQFAMRNVVTYDGLPDFRQNDPHAFTTYNDRGRLRLLPTYDLGDVTAEYDHVDTLHHTGTRIFRTVDGVMFAEPRPSAMDDDTIRERAAAHGCGWALGCHICADPTVSVATLAEMYAASPKRLLSEAMSAFAADYALGRVTPSMLAALDSDGGLWLGDDGTRGHVRDLNADHGTGCVVWHESVADKRLYGLRGDAEHSLSI